MIDFDYRRSKMVERQIRQRGIVEPAILAAFRAVPREAFVPREDVRDAYEDGPLSIGEGQTISQPYVVALAIALLELTGAERVLEIGTGSGYSAAILSCLAKEVFSVERIASLAVSARQRLSSLRYKNVHIACADGSVGLPEFAPYDAIIVAAGGPKIPEALCEQLAPGARLVMPVGLDPQSQTLVRVTRNIDASFSHESIAEVRFVPLIGEAGWN